ncbi:hypothetical protein ACFY05_32250 [Microtetraspora fusca]|uniref:Uncharacterized protein n=1 Tax=Microtetraspora fusca TaxID=1997 RepID=A0ABW6VDW5_MICFU
MAKSKADQADELSADMPAGLVAAQQTAAAPLESPEALAQRSPELGIPDSTTNHIAANAALRSVSGSSHEGLVDADGRPLDIDDVFEWPAAGDPRTVARVTTQVYERFKYPNASQIAMHLLFPAGAEVPLWQAHQLVDKYKAVTSES